MRKLKVKMVCSHCRGENIKVNAYVAWSKSAQAWEVLSTYDDEAWCDDCEGEALFEFMPIGRAAK